MIVVVLLYVSFAISDARAATGIHATCCGKASAKWIRWIQQYSLDKVLCVLLSLRALHTTSIWRFIHTDGHN
jgi:hypothetical protein